VKSTEDRRSIVTFSASYKHVLVQAEINSVSYRIKEHLLRELKFPNMADDEESTDEIRFPGFPIIE
jgi:hypothetical protein